MTAMRLGQIAPIDSSPLQLADLPIPEPHQGALGQTCGACGFCTSGQENLCESARFTGYHADGGYAEYAVVPEDFAYEIPDVFDDGQATPLLCAGIIGYAALRRAEVPRGGRLARYGFGSSAPVRIPDAPPRGL